MKIQIKRVKFIPFGKRRVKVTYVRKYLDDPSQEFVMWTRDSGAALRILAKKNAWFRPGTTFIPIRVQENQMAPKNAEEQRFDGDTFWSVWRGIAYRREEPR